MSRLYFLAVTMFVEETVTKTERVRTVSKEGAAYIGKHLHEAFRALHAETTILYKHPDWSEIGYLLSCDRDVKTIWNFLIFGRDNPKAGATPCFNPVRHDSITLLELGERGCFSHNLNSQRIWYQSRAGRAVKMAKNVV